MKRSLVLLALACDGSPAPVAQPTWADVEPILRVHCNHCHGATAAQTGALGPAEAGRGNLQPGGAEPRPRAVEPPRSV